MTTRIETSDNHVAPAVSESTDAADELSALKAEVIKLVEERFAALSKVIQQRPLLAVGIGFGLGYAIARLLHRKRR
jgi:hypothetical protein